MSTVCVVLGSTQLANQIQYCEDEMLFKQEERTKLVQCNNLVKCGVGVIGQRSTTAEQANEQLDFLKIKHL